MQSDIVHGWKLRRKVVTRTSDSKNGLVHSFRNAPGLSSFFKLQPLGLKSALLDASQALKYGRDRPRRLERIWVDPRQIRRAVIHPCNLVPDQAENDTIGETPFWLARSWRGRVVTAEQFAELEPNLRLLSHNIKFEACRRHWIEGVPWAETGVYDSFLEKIRLGQQKDECETHEDVINRYARLDAIFAEVKAERRLKSQMELFPGQEREIGGIEIHIGPGGEPIFGDSGNHRFAMASVLGLPKLPAMLGFVHEDGLDWLVRYRNEREPGFAQKRRQQLAPVLKHARN